MTFHNKEGNPCHLLLDYNGYHLWLCLFIFYRLLEHHVINKIRLITNNIFSCSIKKDTLYSDIINDENLLEYWDALKGDD